MIIISRKPISINEAYTGRKWKTESYRSFTRDLLYMLPAIQLPPAPYCIEYEFGLSNELADADNPVKPFQDILQKKYKFNDKDVHRIVSEKIIVPIGKEYIKFKITTWK